jgi:hypothetical protein
MFTRTMIAAALAAVSGSAFGADGARPAQLPPTAAGDLALGFGHVWGGGPVITDLDVWQGTAAGKASAPIGAMGWNLEGEADAEAMFVSAGSDHFAVPTQAAAYVHLWKRQPMSAWGLFAGTAPLEIAFTSVGGEFKHYTANASFGAAAAATFFPGSGTGWTINTSANFYPHPDLRIGLAGAVTGGLGQIDPDWTDTAAKVTADIEHRNAGRPVSLWASASWLSNINGESWNALGGFRVFIDRPSSTLQSHEQDVPFTFTLPDFLLPLAG